MKLGIMQPYFFPYIGYFQLIHDVDKFVLLDDVSFKKGGWINRNKMLLHQRQFLFTVPLKNASSFRPLNELEVDREHYCLWRRKFLMTVEHAYKKAPFYNEVYALIYDVLHSDFTTIAQLCSNSLYRMSGYLQITTPFVATSTIYDNRELSTQDRIINIAMRENAGTYINLSGGVKLYSKEAFRRHGIDLKFMISDPIVYDQRNEPFIPSLSIIDVAMFNSVETIKGFLTSYTYF